MIGAPKRKVVCRFCRARDYQTLFNPVDEENQIYCNFCSAWTTLIFAVPAFKVEKRYFRSGAPVTGGKSEIDVVCRSALPDNVKLWALYCLSSIEDSDHKEIKALCAMQVKAAIGGCVIYRAKMSIQRCTQIDLNIDDCIYWLILAVMTADRAGKPLDMPSIAKKLGIPLRKSSSLIKFIDSITAVTKGLGLIWSLGIQKNARGNKK